MKKELIDKINSCLKENGYETERILENDMLNEYYIIYGGTKDMMEEWSGKTHNELKKIKEENHININQAYVKSIEKVYHSIEKWVTRLESEGFKTIYPENKLNIKLEVA